MVIVVVYTNLWHIHILLWPLINIFHCTSDIIKYNTITSSILFLFLAPPLTTDIGMFIIPTCNRDNNINNSSPEMAVQWSL